MITLSIVYLISSVSVTVRRDKTLLFSRVATTITGYCFILSILSLFLTCIEKGLGLFGGLYQTTSNGHTFNIFIYFLSSIIIVLTGFFPRKINILEYFSVLKLLMSEFLYYKTKITDKMGEQFKIIEYPLILLFIIIGACFLLSTGDLVSIFLSIELQSYGLYIIATIYRNSELATSGGLTYFLLGGLSSCFILLSTSLLYANTGVTYLDGMYVVINLCDENYIDLAGLFNFSYIDCSFVVISVGLLFKVSAAPFHFWSPDVYDAIPTIVTTFVAVIGKISIFIFFLELVYYTSGIIASKYHWTYSILLSSLLSLIIGTVVGLSQFRIKRLLAYSTISHVGFILLALSINSVESVQAFLFYLTQYTISNLNVFILLLTLGFSLYYYTNENRKFVSLLDKNNSPIQLISQMKGYFSLNPILSISLATTIFSFVGVPPLVGFFGKQFVLSSALDRGYIFLALVGILTSVIGAVYYLNIIKQLFFDITEYIIDLFTSDLKSKINNINTVEENLLNVLTITISYCLSFSASNLSLLIGLFIFDPQEWLRTANILALIMFNP